MSFYRITFKVETDEEFQQIQKELFALKSYWYSGAKTTFTLKDFWHDKPITLRAFLRVEVYDDNTLSTFGCQSDPPLNYLQVYSNEEILKGIKTALLLDVPIKQMLPDIGDE